MAIDRYVKDDEGFRKYVELMESTPTKKRGALLEAARKENARFIETVEQHILTFERITKLPDLELTEALGNPALKLEVVAVAIASVEDAGVKEKLLNSLPRDLAPKILQHLKDGPVPDLYAAGGARLQVIQATRELEKRGLLKSVQIPRYGVGHFRS